MRPKILVSRKISDLAEEKLQKEFEVTLNPKDEPIPESELIKIVNDYDGMISTGFDKISENFFNNLKIIDTTVDFPFVPVIDIFVFFGHKEWNMSSSLINL